MCAGATFEQQIAWAQIIFVGTVTDVEIVALPTTNVTRYRFEQIRYIKGRGSVDSLILFQDGGGGIFFDEAVSFRKGDRYVVFATKRVSPMPDSYTSLLCGTGHPFGIWPDLVGAPPVVHLGSSEPLVAFDGLHLVALLEYEWRPEMGVWRNGAPPKPPPRLPLDDLIRMADDQLQEDLRGYYSPDQIRTMMRHVRPVHLFRHQDPGPRVSEEEFVRLLAAIVSRTVED
jgi:hypothetical protein